MFTGIVTEVGHLLGVDRSHAHAASLAIRAGAILDNLEVGESISVSGVCLTVTQAGRRSFRADVMPATLNRSSLGQLREGDPVNLERALAVGDRLGGHFVSGHIDDVARILSVRREGNALAFQIACPAGLEPYLVPRGSVAVDGISLTVSALTGEAFEVSVIPHTAQGTTLGYKGSGDVVNIEVDMLGKYVHHLLTSGAFASDDGQQMNEPGHRGGVDADLLRKTGFLSGPRKGD